MGLLSASRNATLLWLARNAARQRLFHHTSNALEALKMCVVGSGPAGFYTVDKVRLVRPIANTQHLKTEPISLSFIPERAPLADS